MATLLTQDQIPSLNLNLNQAPRVNLYLFYILKPLFLALVEIITVHVICPIKTVGKVAEFYACFLAKDNSQESCEKTKNNLCFTVKENI